MTQAAGAPSVHAKLCDMAERLLVEAGKPLAGKVQVPAGSRIDFVMPACPEGAAAAQNS